MPNLSLVDLKIDEIIDILLLHPEVEAPPENYRELGEYLTRFKLQKSPDPLESIRSMVNTFEGNRQTLEEDYEFYELTDESSGEPDSGELWEEGLEETGGSYSDNESFYREFGDKPLDNEAEYLSDRYNQKYGEEYKNSASDSRLTLVERNVVLGLTTQAEKEADDYAEFLAKMLDALKLVGFSAAQVWEIMCEHSNPESQQFDSVDVQYALQEFENGHEYN